VGIVRPYAGALPALEARASSSPGAAQFSARLFSDSRRPLCRGRDRFHMGSTWAVPADHEEADPREPAPRKLDPICRDAMRALHERDGSIRIPKLMSAMRCSRQTAAEQLTAGVAASMVSRDERGVYRWVGPASLSPALLDELKALVRVEREAAAIIGISSYGHATEARHVLDGSTHLRAADKRRAHYVRAAALALLAVERFDLEASRR